MREQQSHMNATANLFGIDIEHKATTIQEIYQSINSAPPLEAFLTAMEVWKMLTIILEKSLLQQHFILNLS